MHMGKGKELEKTEDAAEEDRPRGGRRQGVCLPGRTSLSSCRGPLGPPVRQLLLMPCEEGHALSLSGSPPGLGGTPVPPLRSWVPSHKLSHLLVPQP